MERRVGGKTEAGEGVGEGAEEWQDEEREQKIEKTKKFGGNKNEG